MMSTKYGSQSTWFTKKTNKIKMKIISSFVFDLLCASPWTYSRPSPVVFAFRSSTIRFLFQSKTVNNASTWKINTILLFFSLCVSCCFECSFCFSWKCFFSDISFLYSSSSGVCICPFSLLFIGCLHKRDIIEFAALTFSSLLLSVCS